MDQFRQRLCTSFCEVPVQATARHEVHTARARQTRPDPVTGTTPCKRLYRTPTPHICAFNNALVHCISHRRPSERRTLACTFNIVPIALYQSLTTIPLPRVAYHRDLGLAQSKSRSDCLGFVIPLLMNSMSPYAQHAFSKRNICPKHPREHMAARNTK